MQRQGRPIVKSRPLKRARFEIQASQPVASQPVAMDIVAAPVRKRKSSASVQVEKKFLDNSLAGQALVATTDWTGTELDPATTLCFTAPAQGDTASSRDGKQIICKSLHITGQVFCVPQEATLDPPLATEVFLALVLDTQTNNAQLNGEDVYSLNTANVGLNAFPMRNMNFGKRFKVLKTQRCVFDNTDHSFVAANSFNTSGRVVEIDWYIPLNNLRVNFNSTTTGVIGNVLDNSIHLIGNANSTAQAPTITYQARLRFIG